MGTTAGQKQAQKPTRVDFQELGRQIHAIIAKMQAKQAQNLPRQAAQPQAPPGLAFVQSQRALQPRITNMEAEVPLRGILQAVRPDWSPSDLHAVQEKLAAIQIHFPLDLLERLHAEGSRGVNTRLRA